MNRFSLCTLAALVAIAPFAAKADTVINLNASANPSISSPATAQPPYFYTTLSLGPGTYSVNVFDNTANGGYSGWSKSAANGAPAPNSWAERIGIDLNTAANDYSVTNGVPSYNYNVDNPKNPEAFIGDYSSAAAALAANIGTAYTFTLASASNVTFYIPDQPTTQGYYPGFADNAGGVSLDLVATPEPSSLIMLATGTLTAAGMIKRRFIA